MASTHSAYLRCLPGVVAIAAVHPKLVFSSVAGMMMLASSALACTAGLCGAQPLDLRPPLHVFPAFGPASTTCCCSFSWPTTRLRLLQRWRPCLQASRLGDGAASGEFGVREAAWMRDRLRWELENGGLDCEESLRIGTACAEACTKLFASGFGQFDPMVIMDVMEEEVERRDLRGDFLPFELSHKALQVLQRLWNGSKRPEAVENKLDVVDFDKLPKSEA